MRCRKATHLLHLYVDRRLPLAQTRALEAHLSGCAACRGELSQLEEIAETLAGWRQVMEPVDLHAQIMQRVAVSGREVSRAAGFSRRQERARASRFSPFRPSLSEVLAAILLATVATLISLLQQPGVRAFLPFANGHDGLSLAYTQLLHLFTGMDVRTIILLLWVVGTLLGVVVTLACAGNDMRQQWLRAMMERLPVR